MGRLVEPFRVFGRHLAGVKPGDCVQQVSVVRKGETLMGADKYQEQITVLPYSDFQMIARSPFGVIVYSKENKTEVADLLITLAGQVRRAT